MSPLLVTISMVFKDGSRKKIFLALLTFGVLVVILTFVLSDITFADKKRVILDSGKALMLLFAVFYVLFLGSSWLNENLKEGSLEILMSKPLPRQTFLMGKYIGDLFLLGVILFFMSVVLEIVLLLHVKSMSWMPFINGISIFLESGVLLALAFLVALFASPFVSFFAGLTFFMAGNSIDILLRSIEKSPQFLRAIFKPLIIVWPDFALFDIDKHYLAQGNILILFTVLLLYSIGYLIFFLVSAYFLWKRLEFW